MEEHLVPVKRILRYVARTRGWGVRYYTGRRKEKLDLVGTVIVTWLVTLMIVRAPAG